MESRVGVFVDVSNLYHTCNKAFNRKIDFRALLEFCKQRPGFKIERAIAYGVEASRNRGFKKCLEAAGWEANFKVPKVFSDGTKKADQDLNIAADICRFMDNLDSIILCSADGDFAPVLQLCKDRGKKIIVIGCGLSHELITLADTWYEIEEVLLEPTEAAV